MFMHWTMPVSVILQCTAIVTSTGGILLVGQCTAVDKYISKQLTKAFGSKLHALKYYQQLCIAQQEKFQCQCQRKHESLQHYYGMQSLYVQYVQYMHLSLSHFRLDTTP